MKLFYFFILFLFTACAKAPHSLFTKEDLTLYEKKFSHDEKTFYSPNNLSGILSKEYYEIKARFSTEKSSLKLFSHSRHPNLNDGVQIKINREDEKIKVVLAVQAYPEKVLFEKNNYFENQLEIDWTLKVENGTRYGFRVQIWENFLNTTGIIKQPTSLLTKQNQLADSLKKSLTFYTKGQGLKWGIRTFKSDLISAFRIPNKE